MKHTGNFTKQSFATFISTRYNFSHEEGSRLYDAIGKLIEQTLLEGGTVKLFGTGALKRTQRYVDGPFRIRFRTSPSVSSLLSENKQSDSDSSPE